MIGNISRILLQKRGWEPKYAIKIDLTIGPKPLEHRLARVLEGSSGWDCIATLSPSTVLDQQVEHSWTHDRYDVGRSVGWLGPRGKSAFRRRGRAGVRAESGLAVAI